MPNSNVQRFISSVLSNLGWPIVWGMAAWVGFYALIHHGFITYPLIQRYFAGHIVEYIEAAMFFVGVTALLMKTLDVAFQTLFMDHIVLSERGISGDPTSKCKILLEELEALPKRIQNSYLVNRLRDALEFVRRSDSASGLDDQLRYLADSDADRLHEGNSLVRIIIWATPMLGFLGTVIGITIALGGLNPETLVESPQEAMKSLLAGLSVAFDTTALALSLSLVLMFQMFITSQFQNQLLAAVDQRTEAMLMGRFEQLGTATDPHLNSIQRMAEQVVQSTDSLVRQQTEIWSETISVTHNQWEQLMQSSSQQLRDSLSDSLSDSLVLHAEQMKLSETENVRRSEQLWSQIQSAMMDNARCLDEQNNSLAQQSDMLLKVVTATGDIVKLEQALNDNLRALSGAKNFEDTVMSLSAAIHLLNTKLGNGPNSVARVEIANSDEAGKGRAA